MPDFVKIIEDFFTTDRIWVAVNALLTIIIGFVLIKLLSSIILRFIMKRATPQTQLIVRKVILYSGISFIVLYLFNLLGIELTPLLGAAGIVGIALGFASQTSVSNLISGLFLISEKPFTIGDVISINNNSGVITSIDLLSIKIRTFDNRYIRIPNEKILNNELINITRFPIRRMDIKLSIAYKEDIKRVKEVLGEIAAQNPFSLDEPEPLILLTDFGNSAIEFLMGLWFEKSDYINLKNSIMEEIKVRFDKENIELAYPRLSLVAGSDSSPFELRIQDSVQK
ncbi:MAG: mechanosensitive ion channel family protein [Spirochaetales bacterium]|nr:mechanosensitive ion channel family protein [Spirochaetales bacterium]